MLFYIECLWDCPQVTLILMWLYYQGDTQGLTLVDNQTWPNKSGLLIM